MSADIDYEAELLKALGETPDDVDLTADDIASAPPKQLSQTALELDDWSIRRGAEWANSDDGRLFEPAGESRELVAADMLASAWEPKPRTVEACEDARRHHFLSSMMQTPDYEKLHRSTKLDDVASELAAASFTKQYFELAKMEEPEDELERDGQALQHAMEAIKEAKSEVDTLGEARKSLGGDGAEDGGSMGIDEVRRLYQEIRSNQALRMIMELSGRYRRLAKSMQQAKPIHGNDEVVGVTFDNDLSRVLPVELAIIDDEDLEFEFLRRYAENSLMVREMKSSEAEARGPIVIVVDESGSMHGDPISHAKAMALSILWIAEHQNRWACLVGFAGGTDGNFLVVPPGKRDRNALIEWLTHFYGGGTTCDVPLVTLPDRWESLGCPAGRTDIITITDACVRVPPEVKTRFNAWKTSHEVRMNTIVISDEPGDLANVSDQVFKIKELNLESEGVSECLSL